MKKIIFLCICIPLFYGCDNRHIEKLKQAETDSIAKVEQTKKERSGKARADSLELIAWGDLRFGMSMNEALQTISLKNGNMERNTISMNFDSRFALAQVFGLKELMDFEASFEGDELHFIKIRSAKVTASHIDDLVNDCKILSDNFKKKMGEPVTHINEKVNIFSFNEGEKFLYAQFGIGDKCVLIELGETYSGCEYFYEVSINNWMYPQKKLRETSEEKVRREKEAEKRKQIIDNSF